MNGHKIPRLVAAFAAAAIALAPILTLAQDTLGISLGIADDGQAVPLYLEVFINGKSTDLIAEFSQDPNTGALFSRRSELAEVGIRVPLTMRGKVALDRLAELDYVYDAAAQTVSVTADTSALLPEVISANRHPISVKPDRSFGAVLNYDANANFGEVSTGDIEFRNLSVALDGWVFSPFGVLQNSGIASGSGTDDLVYLRLSTTYEYNAPGTALTFAAGDIVSSSLAWGRSIRMGGVQLRRDFGLRSDLVTEPLLSFTGASAVPSSVDVFIDNNRVFSGRTSQGPYRFEDIPIYHGSGDAVVVVRDENGNVSRREVPFFASRHLLKKGVYDYSLEFGQPREAYGQSSGSYSANTAWSGSLRFGLTNRLTIEAHGEGNSNLTMLGLGAAFVVANRAEITIASGASDYSGQTGYFGYGTFRTNLGKVGMEASILRATPSFTDLAYATAANFLSPATLAADASLLEFPRAQDVISLTLPVGHDNSSFGISFVSARRSASQDQIIALNYGTTLGWRSASLNLSGSHDFQGNETRLSAYLTVPTGKRTFTQASANVNRDTGSAQGLGLTRALGDGVGDYGYQAQLDLGSNSPAWQVAASIRSRAGRGELALRQIDGQTSGRARFDGGLVFMGGDLLLGNQIRDGFAIVDAGVPDVSVYLQNREVVRTNRSGRALVPGLSSYSMNRISLNVDELPDGATYNATAMEVVPARRSGVRVDFGGSNGEAEALVILRDHAGAFLPVGSQIKYDSGETVVGYDGAAYLEGLQSQNRISVRTAKGTCTARFAFEPSGDAQTKIEGVICQ